MEHGDESGFGGAEAERPVRRWPSLVEGGPLLDWKGSSENVRCGQIHDSLGKQSWGDFWMEVGREASLKKQTSRGAES